MKDMRRSPTGIVYTYISCISFIPTMFDPSRNYTSILYSYLYFYHKTEENEGLELAFENFSRSFDSPW